MSETLVTPGADAAGAPKPEPAAQEPTPAGKPGPQEPGGKEPAKEEGKKPEPGKAPDKPPEKAPEKPEDYTLEVPEVFTAESLPKELREANAATLGEVKAWAAKHGVPNAALQELVTAYGKSAEGLNATAAGLREATYAHNQETWIQSLKDDGEFGGGAFEANVKVALKAVQKFSAPGLTDLLNQTGLGSHPEVVKYFWRVGKAMAEPGMEGAQPGDTGARDPAKTLYPDLK
jgi:hypothetical protein